MSAWLCSNKQLSALAEKMVKFSYVQTELPEELAEKLYKQNILGLQERYPESWKKLVRPFKFVPTKFPSLAQAVQTMHSYIYQSSEGRASETDLYHACQSVAESMERELLTATLEEKGAEWDWE